MPKSSFWGAIWPIKSLIEHIKKSPRKIHEKVPPPASETWAIFYNMVPGLKNYRTPISLKAAFRHLPDFLVCCTRVKE